MANIRYRRLRIEGLDIDVDERLLKGEKRIFKYSSNLGSKFHDSKEDFEYFIKSIVRFIFDYDPIRFDYNPSLRPSTPGVYKHEGKYTTEEARDRELPITCLLKVTITDNEVPEIGPKCKKSKRILIECNCLPFLSSNTVSVVSWAIKYFAK